MKIKEPLRSTSVAKNTHSEGKDQKPGTSQLVVEYSWKECHFHSS